MPSLHNDATGSLAWVPDTQLSITTGTSNLASHTPTLSHPSFLFKSFPNIKLLCIRIIHYWKQFNSLKVFYFNSFICASLTSGISAFALTSAKVYSLTSTPSSNTVSRRSYPQEENISSSWHEKMISNWKHQKDCVS